MNAALDFEGLDGILAPRVGDEDELAPPAHDGAMVQLGVQPLAGRPWEGHRGAEPGDTEWPTVVADSAPMYAEGAPARVVVEGPSVHEQVELPDAGDEGEGDAFGLRLDGADHRRDEIPEVASLGAGEGWDLGDPGVASVRIGDGAASIRSTVASVRVGDGAGRARSGEAVGAQARAATVPAGVRAASASQGLLAGDGVAPPAGSGGSRASVERLSGAGVPGHPGETAVSPGLSPASPPGSETPDSPVVVAMPFAVSYESAPRRGPAVEHESSPDGRGPFASAGTPRAGPHSELRPAGRASPARPLSLVAAVAAAAILAVAVLGAVAVWSGLEGAPARTPTPGGPARLTAAGPGSEAGSMEPRAVAQEGAAAAHPPEPPSAQPGSPSPTPEPGAPEPGPTSPSTQPRSTPLTPGPGVPEPGLTSPSTPSGPPSRTPEPRATSSATGAASPPAPTARAAEPGAPEPGPSSPSTQPASRSLTSEPGAGSLATATGGSATSLAVVPPARAADVPSSSERVFVVRFAYGDETPLSRLLPDWVATCPRLVVVGHTDDRGTEASNVALGLARARAAYALAHANPRPSDEVTSAGAARPASDNTTPEGRRLNRRAEITCR